MGRPGITYWDVANAAQQLQGEGKNITIETIRARLGSGSSGTIAAHLRAWKTQQNETEQLASKEKLPDTLVSLMKGLWEQVMTQADQKIQFNQAETQEIVKSLQEELWQLQQENNRWQQQYQQIYQEKQQLANAKLVLEQTFTELQNNHTALQANTEGLHQRLQDKEERINELHRLHQQTQANLEHYREVSREQRLNEQRQYEQQKSQLEQFIRQYQQENALLKDQVLKIEKQNSQLSTEYDAIKSQYDKIMTEFSEINTQLKLKQEQLTKVLYSEQQWQAQHQISQGKNDQYQKTNINLQKQIAALEQKQLITQSRLDEIKDQNKSLAHEKLFLAQEKAQLIGQLQQLRCI